MAKALLFLRAAPGAAGELLAQATTGVEQLFSHSSGVHSTLRVMEKLPDDPLCNCQGSEQMPDITVEIKTVPGLPLAAAATADALHGLLSPGLVDCNQSLALIMHQRIFRPAPPQPLVYHYLMVRAPGFFPADYHDYYVNYHSQFGLITPGIEGYSQNYIDQAGSKKLGATLNLGFREVTSISEMDIAEMDNFLSSPAMAEVGPAAAEDEARFVDRDASIMFTSRVVCSLGDHTTIGDSHFA